MKGKSKLIYLLCFLVGWVAGDIEVEINRTNNTTNSLTTLQHRQEKSEGRMLKIINGTCDRYICHESRGE